MPSQPKNRIFRTKTGGLSSSLFALRRRFEDVSMEHWDDKLRQAGVLKILSSNVTKFAIRSIYLSLLKPYEKPQNLSFVANHFKHQQLILFMKSIRFRSTLESIELFNISGETLSERDLFYILQGTPANVKRFVHNRYLSNLDDAREPLPYSSLAAFMIRKFLVRHPQLKSCRFLDSMSFKNRNVILSGWISSKRQTKLKDLGELVEPVSIECSSNSIDFSEFQ